MSPLPPNLFTYQDYREFLRDWYLYNKSQNSKFSHRYFAQKAGIQSSGFFASVLSGKRNITQNVALKFSKALKLNREQKDYFLTLVHFNQSKTLEEKNHHYQRMLAFRKLDIEELPREKHEFYSKWWYSAIRELLHYHPFHGDYKELAGRLDPPIRPEQAKKAIQLLVSLGLVKKDSRGRYWQTQNLITTGNKPMHAGNFQRETMELAKQSLDRHPRQNRNISTLTVTLSPESWEAVQARITGLKKMILSLAEAEQNPDRVVQINLQAFPLTRLEDGKDDA